MAKKLRKPATYESLEVCEHYVLASGSTVYVSGKKRIFFNGSNSESVILGTGSERAEYSFAHFNRLAVHAKKRKETPNA